MIVTADGKDFVAVKDRTSASTRDVPCSRPTRRTDSSRRGVAGPTTNASSAVFAVANGTNTCSKVYPVTRLVAVNRDGSKQTKLLQNPFQPSGQINDRIIDWTPEEPDAACSSRS